MRLRTRKASQQSNQIQTQRTARAKRKHSEVDDSLPSGGEKPPKTETGLLSSIKKFIKGSTPKVMAAPAKYTSEKGTQLVCLKLMKRRGLILLEPHLTECVYILVLSSYV